MGLVKQGQGVSVIFCMVSSGGTDDRTEMSDSLTLSLTLSELRLSLTLRLNFKTTRVRQCQ